MTSTEQLTAAIYSLISSAATSATGGVHLDQAGEHVAAPYVVFSIVSEVPQHTHSGECGGVIRVQVDAFASSAELAAQVKDEVKTALSGYSGALNGVTIGAIFRLSSFGGFEDETNLYRQSTDYRISHN